MQIPTISTDAEMLQFLRQTYGTRADRKEWIHKRYYSYVSYLEAGASEFTFFADQVGSNGITRQHTNLEQASKISAGDFLLKGVFTGIQIPSLLLASWDGTDASTLCSDLLAGFVQAGVLTFTVGADTVLKLPKPFLYAGMGAGNLNVRSAGLNGITLAEGAPNTFTSDISAAPFADLAPARKTMFLFQDTQPFIAVSQTISGKIAFPSGIVPVIGTGVTHDSTNILKIGMVLDGLLIRDK